MCLLSATDLSTGLFGAWLSPTPVSSGGCSLIALWSLFCPQQSLFVWHHGVFPCVPILSFYLKTPGDPVGSDSLPASFFLSVTVLRTLPASWGLGPTGLCSKPCRTAVFHLPSSPHITHQIASLDHNLVSFSSLKDHGPLLLVFSMSENSCFMLFCLILT